MRQWVNNVALCVKNIIDASFLGNALPNLLRLAEVAVTAFDSSDTDLKREEFDDASAEGAVEMLELESRGAAKPTAHRRGRHVGRASSLGPGDWKDSKIDRATSSLERTTTDEEADKKIEENAVLEHIYRR